MIMTILRRGFGALLLVLAWPLSAQVDIPNNSRNALMDLGRGLAWGSGGRGNVHNAYIFTPVSPSESFCLMVFNRNTTNAHTFSFTVASTADQQVTNYLTASARWIAAGAVTNAVVAANSAYYNFYRVNGASRVAISFSGSSTQAGSPDTADISIAQSTILDTGGGGCAPINTPGASNTPGATPGTTPATGGSTTFATAAITCPNRAAFNLSAGTNVQIVTGTNTVRICHLDYTSDTSASLTIQQGTGTTCLTSTVALTGVYPLVTGMVQDYGPASPLQTTLAAQNVCLHLSAASTIGGVVIYADF